MELGIIFFIIGWILIRGERAEKKRKECIEKFGFDPEKV